ncbi:MAG: biotin-dependent carboxyltransferase family protein [Bacteroidota bacterium]
MDKLLHIDVRKAGLLTSMQHPEQVQFAAFGVPFGGPMDQQAANAANLILGNSPSTPILEITLMGPELHFSHRCIISITGADLSPSLNGEETPSYQAVNVPADSLLTFGRAKSGFRAYLGIRGEWQHAPGLQTQALRKEDRIAVRLLPNVHTEIQIQPRDPLPLQPTIYVSKGPEFYSFTKEYIAWFFSRLWRITPDSNRMGYRLEADNPPEQGPKEIISSGILPGTIQITGSGQPVILMADAQTTGGYPRIACVNRKGLDMLAQFRPGTQVRFTYQPHYDT